MCVLGGVNQERSMVGSQEEMPHCSSSLWRTSVEKMVEHEAVRSHEGKAQGN